MKTVYVAGNPLVKEDSIPLCILPRLKINFPQLKFCELEPTDELPEERELIIIDTVIGIKKVRVISDIDKIETGKRYSLHDFDLGFNLKLLKKAGRIDSVTIICIPAGISEEKAYDGAAEILRKLLRIKN